MLKSLSVKSEARGANRRRVGISADVFDPNSEDRFYCLVLDATRDGCRMFCDSLGELPDEVCLQPEGLKKPIKAEIRWRKGKAAGLKFDWADTLF